MARFVIGVLMVLVLTLVVLLASAVRAGDLHRGKDR